MLSGEGTVYETGRSVVVRIPKDVAQDSTFPFQIGDHVYVYIKDGKVIVEKLESGRTSNIHNQP